MNKLNTIVVFCCLISLLLSCSGQQPKPQKVQYDTLKLLSPKPTPEDSATAQDYNHCIDLTDGQYLVTIKGVRYPNSNLKDLLFRMQKSKKEIGSQKLSIVTDGDRYQEVVDVLDQLQILGIDKYKLVRGGPIAEYPIVIQVPAQSEKIIDKNDPSVLNIWIQTDTLSVTLQNNSGMGNIADIERFIMQNKKNIDPDKIFISATGNTTFPQFEAVINLLKKYKYEKYRLSVKEK
jgi:biopolymer transport protein ExbD